MHTITETKLSVHHLTYLPAYAQYLLQHKLSEFAKMQLKISRELHMPLLKYFERFSEEEIIQLTIQAASEYLTYLAQNRAQEQIDTTVQKWIANQLAYVTKENIASEDITLISYMRKRAFLHFIPGYCRDVESIIELSKEIDVFLMRAETAFSQIYINLLRERIEEQSYLNTQITNTSPGIIYLFNLTDFSIAFVNERAEEFFDLTKQEFIALGNKVLPALIHPDDVPATLDILNSFYTARDGEIRTLEYRLKNARGEYVWMRNYMAVFKRNNQGQPEQIIGNVLNINTEKLIAGQLKHREEQLIEAQEVAEMGSFDWNITSREASLSDQLKHILKDAPLPATIDEYINNIHPEDREVLEQCIDNAIGKTGFYECEYRYAGPDKEKILWSRGKVIHEDKEVVKIRGIVMDVTKQASLLKQLRHSNEMHQQAQALSHIGHFTLHLKTNSIEYTDEFYRIYGYDTSEEKPTSYEHFVNHRHPEDNDWVTEAISKAIETYTSFDFHFRIIAKGGKEKILHALGELVIRQDEPVQIVGTMQDVTERQNLIQRLQRSENLYKQAQALAHVGNWTWNIPENKIEWSDELYRIYGLAPQSEPLSYERYISFIHPEDKQLVTEQIQRSMHNFEPYTFIHRIIWEDGSVHYLSSTGEVQKNDQGKASLLFGTAQDVTQQKEFEKQISENKNFIQKIADATPSIIAAYNVRTGQYTFINEGLTKLLGYPVGEVLQKGAAFFRSIIHPDDNRELSENNAEVIQKYNGPEYRDSNDVVTEFKYRMKHKNGGWRWFHTYGTIFDRNGAGEIEHILNISLDITDRIEAEARLAEQELFIKHIADASPTILYLYDVEEDTMAYVNREIFFVLGYTPEEIMELKSSVNKTLYHEEDFHLLPERKNSGKEFKEQDSMIQYECRMRHKDGEWRWFLVREIAFKANEKGEVLQVLGAALDINRRKEMERSLLHNSFQLEQSNASLEEFAYVASHDLKEPLRKITTFGDRLIATQFEKLTEDGRIYLNKIVDASQRMQVMISDLLSISLISGNKSFEVYNLQMLLEDVLQTLEVKIEQKNAVIKWDPLPEARIIPSQFRQLFQNLLSNSLKFVREDVQPLIRITHQFLKPEKVSDYQVATADSYQEIQFQDNGIGFENEFAGKIFAIFQRLHGRSEYEGTGIGLAICKKIVEHHGGVIFASGSPGEGATFTIILPA